jgi:hypothetical protein
MSGVLKVDPSGNGPPGTCSGAPPAAGCLTLVEEADAWASRQAAFLRKYASGEARPAANQENRLIEDVLNRDIGTKD